MPKAVLFCAVLLCTGLGFWMMQRQHDLVNSRLANPDAPAMAESESEIRYESPFQAIRRNLSAVPVKGTGTWIALLFIAALFSLIVGSLILQWSKGSLKISVAREKTYHPNDTIEGMVAIHARKDIHCRKVTISLRCHSRSGSGNSTTRCLYRDSLVLQGEAVIPRGATIRLPFQLVVPEKIATALPIDIASAVGDGALGRFAKSLLSASEKLERMNALWELYAEVDAEGVDLTTARSVVVQRVG